MEANIEVIDLHEIAGEPVGNLKVKHSPLKPFSINEEIMPRLIDEIPILTVAACFCNGESFITGASELRIKETDRLAVITRQLTAMGAKIEEQKDGLIIRGGTSLKGTVLDSETDHRIAMSLAVAAMLAEGNSQLIDSEAASVSYPDFWEDLARLHN